MLFEIIAFSILGIGLGTIAGMVPGLHVNVMIPLILSLLFVEESPYLLVVLIVSVSISEIFINFIPSIFLGAPEEDTALSVLPGHRLLLEGRGYEAIKLTVIGGVGAIISSIIFISLAASWFRYLYEISRPYVHYFISLVLIFMIFSEREFKKMVSAVLIIFLSGMLGLLTLNTSLVPQQNVLFPVLTGLFGLSTLFVSISQRANIPKQVEDIKIKISTLGMIKSILLAALAGIIVGFLPAIGVSQAATMVQYLGGTGEPRGFLVTVSGISTSNDVFSLISLYLVENPRSGASVAIERILTELTFYDVLLVIGVICFVSGISAVLTLALGKKIPKYLEKINYRKICLSVITLLLIMTFLLTGPFGLLISFTSTSIGLLCIYLGIKRSHCMGCLLIPSIFYFAGLNPFIIELLRI